jgi:5-methylcytosine-specific restriction protein A
LIAEKQDQIAKEIEEGIGASISVIPNRTGRRTGLRIWFSDLSATNGPVAELRPEGLKGYKVLLTFGRSSGLIINQIRAASLEDVILAKALIKSIGNDVELDINGQNDSDWAVCDGSFSIIATIRQRHAVDNEDTVISICREVIVPMLAAMAELIGYDEIINDSIDAASNLEGSISVSEVKRRERNPRNRLLCIRIHGNTCKICGLMPQMKYGSAGMILEVHHLQPLSSLTEPRAYNPTTDLIPLCPNCHRAVHTRRPIPLDLNEIRILMESACG